MLSDIDPYSNAKCLVFCTARLLVIGSSAAFTCLGLHATSSVSWLLWSWMPRWYPHTFQRLTVSSLLHKAVGHRIFWRLHMIRSPCYLQPPLASSEARVWWISWRLHMIRSPCYLQPPVGFILEGGFAGLLVTGPSGAFIWLGLHVTSGARVWLVGSSTVEYIPRAG